MITKINANRSMIQPPFPPFIDGQIGKTVVFNGALLFTTFKPFRQNLFRMDEEKGQKGDADNAPDITPEDEGLAVFGGKLKRGGPMATPKNGLFRIGR